MISSFIGRHGMKASRRRVYRQSKRLLIRLMAGRWSGPRLSLEPAVRGFLRARSRSYLLNLAGNRAFALAAAATLLATGAVHAIPPIELSDVAAGSGGFIIDGVGYGGQSGMSVSGVGDFNGDGVPDIIVGAPYARPYGGNIHAGKSYVVFGKSDTEAVNLPYNFDKPDTVLTINGINLEDRSGRSVSGAGDFNGDGLNDVIIGAPNAGLAGESYVIFGRTDNTTVELADIVAGSKSGFVIYGIDSGDLSGISVSGAGDVNNDGLADIIIGAHGASPGGISSAGESYVIFGKANTNPVSLVDIAAGIGGFVINGNDLVDQSGRSVSGAGDVNGDGLDDLIIGAPRADGNGNKLAGESYVVFGKANTDAVELSDIIAGDGGFVINGPITFCYSRSGYSVSGAGDVNGDGLDDVIIGAPKCSYDYPPAGNSYVVFGKVTTETVNLSPNMYEGEGFTIHGGNGVFLSGTSVSGAGDVNGDGLDDVIIGAPNPGYYDSPGKSFVVFGKADSDTLFLSGLVNNDKGIAINGIDLNDKMGTSVSAAGDINGDGLDDVIVGAPEGEASSKDISFNSGESYVIFSPVVWGDLDSDGSVNEVDLQMLLDNWGKCPKPCVPYCPGDLDRNCTVGTSDLLILLANWD